jgi:YcxB-like protein
MTPTLLKYNFTKEDYTAYYNYTLWSSGTIKKRRRNDFLKTAGSIVIYAVMFYYFFGRKFPIKFTIPTLILIIGVSLLPYIGYKNKIDKQLEDFLNDEDNANIFTKTAVQAGLQGLYVKNEFEETTYQWKSIIKKIEIDTHYFLYTNSAQAIIIPKNAFINKVEKIAFDKILSTTLSLDAQLKQDISNANK